MDQYVTVSHCSEAMSGIKIRMKWLAWLMVFMIGITSLTAEEAWRARSGFEDVKSRLETTSGVSASEQSGIQRSLERIDRKLEAQEIVLMELLRARGSRE